MEKSWLLLDCAGEAVEHLGASKYDGRARMLSGDGLD